MRERSRRAACVLGTGLWIAGLGPTGSGAAEHGEDDAGTRATMGRIVEALRVALPPSLSPERFRDPDRRDAILAALRRLAESGDELEEHGQERDAGFSFLSRSLARDASDIVRRYERGRFKQARFLLHELTETCVACHSRLPYDRESPLAAQLFEEEQIAALPLTERATLQAATRRFDAALDSLETLFADPEVSPDFLDFSGHLDVYLEIAIRVRRDPARAIAALETLKERANASPVLLANLEHWIASLRELRDAPSQPASLEQARALLREAEEHERFAYERQALVHYVAASGVLLRWIAEHDEPEARVAEAFYRLGVIESRVGRSFWLAQTEFYLERAIRLDPDGPFAEPAFALLEETTLSGYTGSGGVKVPADVRERLEALRGLIDAAASTPAAGEPA